MKKVVLIILALLFVCSCAFCEVDKSDNDSMWGYSYNEDMTELTIELPCADGCDWTFYPDNSGSYTETEEVHTDALARFVFVSTNDSALNEGSILLICNLPDSDEPMREVYYTVSTSPDGQILVSEVKMINHNNNVAS